MRIGKLWKTFIAIEMGRPARNYRILRQYALKLMNGRLYYPMPVPVQVRVCSVCFEQMTWVGCKLDHNLFSLPRDTNHLHLTAVFLVSPTILLPLLLLIPIVTQLCHRNQPVQDVHPTGQAPQAQGIQVLGRGPQLGEPICYEALLHECGNQMLSHEYGVCTPPHPV